MGVGGFVMNIGGQSITGNGDREVKEGKGSVGDGPCEDREMEFGNKLTGSPDESLKWYQNSH